MSSPGLRSATLNLGLQLIILTVCKAVFRPRFRCTRGTISAKIIDEDEQETAEFTWFGISYTKFAITNFNAHYISSGLSDPPFRCTRREKQSKKTSRKPCNVCWTSKHLIRNNTWDAYVSVIKNAFPWVPSRGHLALAYARLETSKNLTTCESCQLRVRRIPWLAYSKLSQLSSYSKVSTETWSVVCLLLYPHELIFFIGS